MGRTILITGGAGFIGSHVVRLFVGKYPDCRIVNVDKLTYAGNPLSKLNFYRIAIYFVYFVCFVIISDLCNDFSLFYFDSAERTVCCTSV